MSHRIRIRTAAGQIHIVDRSFSQTVETAQGLTAEQRKQFWNHIEVDASNGDNLYLMPEPKVTNEMRRGFGWK